MGSYIYDDITAFLPQKVTQVNLYVYNSSGSLTDTFAIKQIMEGSQISIDPINQQKSNGLNLAVGYRINTTFVFMQNDIGSALYYPLLRKINSQTNTIKFTVYMQFDGYERMISISPFKDISAGNYQSYECSLRVVEMGMFEFSCTAIVDANQLENIFYNF